MEGDFLAEFIVAIQLRQLVVSGIANGQKREKRESSNRDVNRVSYVERYNVTGYFRKSYGLKVRGISRYRKEICVCAETARLIYLFIYTNV